MKQLCKIKKFKKLSANLMLVVPFEKWLPAFQNSLILKKKLNLFIKDEFILLLSAGNVLILDKLKKYDKNKKYYFMEYSNHGGKALTRKSD